MTTDRRDEGVRRAFAIDEDERSRVGRASTRGTSMTRHLAAAAALLLSALTITPAQAATLARQHNGQHGRRDDACSLAEAITAINQGANHRE